MVRRGPSRLHSGNSLTASLFGPACWLTGSRAVSSAHRTCQVDPVGQLQPMCFPALVAASRSFCTVCIFWRVCSSASLAAASIPLFLYQGGRTPQRLAKHNSVESPRTAGGRRLSLTDEGQPLYQEVLSARTKVARELTPYTMLYCPPSRVCAGRCSASSE